VAIPAGYRRVTRESLLADSERPRDTELDLSNDGWDLGAPVVSDGRQDEAARFDDDVEADGIEVLLPDGDVDVEQPSDADSDSFVQWMQDRTQPAIARRKRAAEPEEDAAGAKRGGGRAARRRAASRRQGGAYGAALDEEDDEPPAAAARPPPTKQGKPHGAKAVKSGKKGGGR
jgi:hypothetical protein